MTPIDPVNPVDPSDSAADQVQCMLSHCAIQYADCAADIVNCLPCLSDYTQSYCPTNAKFEALTRCEQCHCVEGMESSCEGGGGGGGGGTPSCGPEEIGVGGMGFLDWQTCTGIGNANNMITDWDENNFGALDSFETCSHAYADQANHGGRTAEQCMQILADAAGSKADDVVTDIARQLYWKPGKMCECSATAWAEVPTCNTFSRFKVLVHETLDACTSLDQIDCDAWKDFSDACERNLKAVFGNVDFYKQKQCDYVKDGCGGSGAFPAFRKLDCGGEIPKKNWDMWNAYSTGCALAVATDDDIDVAPPDPEPPKPEPNPPSPGPEPDSGGAKKHGGSAAGPVIGVLAALSLVVGGAVLYKRRRDGDALSSAYRYRPQRNESLGDSEMFAGMNVNMGSFKPPSVPQTHNI